MIGSYTSFEEAKKVCFDGYELIYSLRQELFMFSLDDLKSAGSKLKSVNIKNQKAFNQNANGKHLKTGIHAFKLRKGKFS